MGSIFSLDGGFFAKGDLIINAVVGKVKKETGSANFNFDIQTEVEPLVLLLIIMNKYLKTKMWDCHV